MTGCGKTTVGTYLSHMTERKFIDTDKMIVEGEGKSIPEIFSQYGESRFREIETLYLKKAIETDVPAIISTGGGIVLREENRKLIFENTFSVWLIRKRADIIRNPNILNRPPIYGDIENYDRIYESRKSLYSETACIAIQNEDSKKTADILFETLHKKGILK